jgi:endonuclease/exonuclease/phosphatase family metal-dependent hydrolase
MLTGDFNAPRGDNRIYRQLSERFKDTIPLTIKTTMDVDLHKAGKDPQNRVKLSRFVVDYIFSTPEYRVSNVRQEFGLSDHSAIIAEVARVV